MTLLQLNVPYAIVALCLAGNHQILTIHPERFRKTWEYSVYYSRCLERIQAVDDS